MSQPNFFIIGSTKSGTSSLARYLPQHPDIAMCQIKEPHYFSQRATPEVLLGVGHEHWPVYGTDHKKAYADFFEHAGTSRVIGEASTSYINTPGTAELIRSEIPHARILAVLRNPIERAFSAYMHLKRDGRETLSFSEGLAAEPARIRQNYSNLWRYRSLGFYTQQLQPYRTQFPPEQLWITTYDYWRNQPEDFLTQLFCFLSVDDTISINRKFRDNVSGIPRWCRLHHFITQPSLAKTVLTPLIPKALRHNLVYGITHWNLQMEMIPAACWDELASTYRNEIRDLEKLIQQDLSHWLERPQYLR